MRLIKIKSLLLLIESAIDKYQLEPRLIKQSSLGQPSYINMYGS